MTDDRPVYVISVAAELAGMHPQTLRGYDRLGLVSPRRTSGQSRRYSDRDVELLREVHRLSQEEGVSLAGVKRIIELQNQVAALQARVAELQREVAAWDSRALAEATEIHRSYRREVVPYQPQTSVVVYQSPRRPRN